MSEWPSISWTPARATPSSSQHQGSQPCRGSWSRASSYPPGHELASFFGASRMTVQTAIRTLRDEGFVRSLAGSGVYVREQASLPGPEDAEHPLAGSAAFLFEMGQLKNQPRTGWQPLGIQRPESDRDADPGDRVQALGADTRQWQENAVAALRTDAGAELARAVTSSSPQWWAAFSASYSELRAITRAHKQVRKPVEWPLPYRSG
jgi:biotin operon repressor